MRLVSAVSAGAGCSIASGRSASSSSSRGRTPRRRSPGQPRGRLRGAARRARVDGPDRLEAAIEVVRACRARSRRAAPRPAGTPRSRGRRRSRPTRCASASPSAIGTSTDAPDGRRSAAKSAKTVAASAWRAIRAPARLERAVEALALEGAEEHRRGRAGEQLVLDRARQRDQRRLAQHLRPGAVVGRPPPRRRSTDGPTAPPVSRARSSAALTESPRSRWARARRSVSTSSGS